MAGTRTAFAGAAERTGFSDRSAAMADGFGAGDAGEYAPGDAVGRWLPGKRSLIHFLTRSARLFPSGEFRHPDGRGSWYPRDDLPGMFAVGTVCSGSVVRPHHSDCDLRRRCFAVETCSDRLMRRRLDRNASHGIEGTLRKNRFLFGPR